MPCCGLGARGAGCCAVTDAVAKTTRPESRNKQRALQKRRSMSLHCNRHSYAISVSLMLGLGFKQSKGRAAYLSCGLGARISWIAGIFKTAEKEGSVFNAASSL